MPLGLAEGRVYDFTQMLRQHPRDRLQPATGVLAMLALPSLSHQCPANVTSWPHCRYSDHAPKGSLYTAAADRTAIPTPGEHHQTTRSGEGSSSVVRARLTAGDKLVPRGIVNFTRNPEGKRPRPPNRKIDKKRLVYGVPVPFPRADMVEVLLRQDRAVAPERRNAFVRPPAVSQPGRYDELGP